MMKTLTTVGFWSHDGQLFQSVAVEMSRLTVLESAVGASGPTTGASFSILKT
jgi:hypothetical protein